jgi:hypothetical protein
MNENTKEIIAGLRYWCLRSAAVFVGGSVSGWLLTIFFMETLTALWMLQQYCAKLFGN